MKNLKKISFLSIICFLFVFAACSGKKLLKVPDKIIVYKSGEAKILSPRDKIFKEIVNLTNKRIDENKVSTVKDGGSINNKYINDLKRSTLAVEFIYTSSQKMEAKDDGFTPMNYSRLFFQLKDLKPDSSDGYNSYNKTFQYGTEENYTGSSRGPITESKELIELVETLEMDTTVDDLLNYLH